MSAKAILSTSHPAACLQLRWHLWGAMRRHSTSYIGITYLSYQKSIQQSKSTFSHFASSHLKDSRLQPCIPTIGPTRLRSLTIICSGFPNATRQLNILITPISETSQSPNKWRGINILIFYCFIISIRYYNYKLISSFT